MSTPHLSLEKIAALLDGALSPEETSNAEVHLASGCAECAANAADLRVAMRALASYSLEPAPRAVVERALEALRERQAGGAAVLGRMAGELAARVAALVFDSWKTPALAGTRGSVAPVRQLVYELEDDRYTLHVQRDSDSEPYVLRGRVFLTRGSAAGIPVHLSSAAAAPTATGARSESGGAAPSGARARSVSTGRSRKTKTEATGEFLFENVRRGRYTVRIEIAGGDVTLGGIDLP